MNDNDAGSGPTMREILDTAARVQLDRILREIIENAEALRAIATTGEPADKETINRHVRAISFYANALQRQMNGVKDGQ